MPDKKLVILVALIIVLGLGHDIDHFIRGDFRLWLTAESAPVLVTLIAKYAILGAGLYFYMKNKLGPLFWAIVAGISVALGWLAHFSPFSDQTPQFIYRAYQSPAGGALAVGWLAALMLVLIITTVYAQYLWARAR
ncbi:MAG: hypothetical protein L0Y50_05035 [Beijerinckiaceae bacterium]|nr:hypothetical protein [Beijerinckiaceae bacterium]MCI0735622.1 hypothetical protein [Beijerinckiaceae bacterium]